MPTDVDTDRGGQLVAGPGASVRYVSSPVPSGKGLGEGGASCRLPFRQAEARSEPRCVSAPSASHTRQSHHTPASRLCAQTGRSPPSGRAGEPGGTTLDGGGGRARTPREERLLEETRHIMREKES